MPIAPLTISMLPTSVMISVAYFGNRRQRRAHSITPSARSSTDCGIAMPSSRATLRLMISSNLRRPLDRQLAGACALEDAVDVAGRAAQEIVEIGAVRHQDLVGTEQGELADHRDALRRREGIGDADPVGQHEARVEVNVAWARARWARRPTSSTVARSRTGSTTVCNAHGPGRSDERHCQGVCRQLGPAPTRGRLETGPAEAPARAPAASRKGPGR